MSRAAPTSRSPRARATLGAAVAAMMAALAFAGCSDGGGGGPAGPAAGEGGEEPELEAGKGAISGLLIDDRYRPLPGGLVLLQGGPENVGLTANSNEDGEFTFVNLVPGTYTARATLEGHEAAPQSIQVTAGKYEELNLEARRILSQGSYIVTAEYSVFIPCAVSSPAVTGTHGYCFYDMSGDSYRPGLSDLNFSGEKNVTYALFEMKANQPNNFELVVRHDNGDSFGGEEYGSSRTRGGDYAKVILQYVTPDAVDPVAYDGNSTHWNNTKPMAALLFYLGVGGEEAEQAGCDAPPLPVDPPPLPGTPVTNPIDPSNQPACRGFFGVGHAQAIRAQIVISLFLGEPTVDVATYQVLQASA